MPAVLTAASSLVCPHGAPLVITPSQQLLAVDGQPVLVRADLFTATMPACQNKPPCGSVASVDTGLSTALWVAGQQVLLETAQGSTLAGAPWRVVSAGQTKLETA
ncbi:hypothetical protein ABT404_48440 [Streptomyces hyaluromycini]|uniref:Lipoprotein n=1 Tax=Streptomyces hyaluromycini TaxID=1377993 RepID=A0ABV1XE25_9ACTN